jgi:hypothetical protein
MHPRLLDHLERTLSPTVETLPHAAEAFAQWRQTHTPLVTLYGVVKDSHAFVGGLGLSREARLGQSVFQSPEVFAASTANDSLLHAVSFDAAARVIELGFAQATMLRPRLRVRGAAPAGEGSLVKDGALRGLGFRVEHRADALRHLIRWPGGTTEAFIVGPDRALQDSRLETLALSGRGRTHALVHLGQLDTSTTPPPMARELRAHLDLGEPALTDALIEQYLSLYRRFGQLGSASEGPLVCTTGEHPYEAWAPDAFATPADAAAAEGCRLFLLLRWCRTLRDVSETLAFLDERGRVWGYSWGREDFRLLAESHEVWVERTVRAMSCRSGPAHGQHRHPDVAEAGRHGEAWAKELSLELVPEASDAVLRVFESDDALVVEDLFADVTSRYAFDGVGR